MVRRHHQVSRVRKRRHQKCALRVTAVVTVRKHDQRGRAGRRRSPYGDIETRELNLINNLALTLSTNSATRNLSIGKRAQAQQTQDRERR